MKITKTEHFGIQRKIVASTTSDSWQNIPHVGYIYEADVTDFFTKYKEMNSEYKSKITFNTLMLKVIIEGLKAAPQLNAHIEYNKKLVRGRIDTLENIDVSMPMILPNGEMMTVRLQNFENKNLDEMSRYIEDVRRRAENTNIREAMYSVSIHDTIKGLKNGKILKTIYRLYGSKTGSHKVKNLKGKEKKAYYSILECDRLTREDLQQGSVTISNVGSTYLGGSGSVSLLEIVPPQVSAFAIGSIQKKPAVITDENGNDKIAVRSMLPICIAFDHRALDFADVVPFMKKLDEIFQNPDVIFSWRGEEKMLKSVKHSVA